MLKESQLAVVEKVKQLRSEGLDVKQACRKAKITSSSYYSYLKRMGNSPGRLRRKSKPTQVETMIIPTQSTAKMAVVFGSPEQIAQLIGSL